MLCLCDLEGYSKHVRLYIIYIEYLCATQYFLSEHYIICDSIKFEDLPLHIVMVVLLFNF